MTSIANKRAYPRYAVKLDAVISTPQGKSAAGVIENVCLGGLFATFYNQPGAMAQWQNGERIAVRFPADAQHAYMVTGRIVRVVDIGIGVAFEQPDQNAVQFLMGRAQAAQHTASPASSGPADARYATLAAGCREKTKVFLERIVEDFVHNAATALDQDEELSKKNWRGIMETQQKLRSARQGLMNCYGKAIQDEYESKGKPIKQQASLEEATELSLVADQEFQNWLTASALISKIDSRNEEVLFGLEQRLGLVLNRPLDKQNNPIGATQLATRFQECFDEIVLEDEMKPIVFKAFEELMLEQIGAFYTQINKFLVDQGVMPELKKDFKLMRPGAGARRPAAPPPPPTAEAAAGEEQHPPPDAGAGYGYDPAAYGAGAYGGSAPAGGAGATHAAPGGAVPPGGGMGAAAAAVPGGAMPPAGGMGGGAAGAAQMQGGAGMPAAGGYGAAGAPYTGPAGLPMGGGEGAGVTSFAAASELMQLERTARQARTASGPGAVAGEAGEAAAAGAPAASAARGGGAAVHYSAQEMTSGLSQLRQQGTSIRQLRQQGHSLASYLNEVMVQQAGGDTSKQLPDEAHDRLEITESLLSSIQTDPIADAGLKGWFERVELPFAQVALLNEQVLHDRSHPVHHLFNTMDQLCQILPAEKAHVREELVGKVEKVLHSLSEEPGGDPELLAEAVEAVDKAYGEQSEEYRSRVEELIAKCKAETNHRQLTLDLLEDIDALFELAPQRMIPRVVLELLDAGWKNLLWRHCLKDGIKGDGYRSSRATMEQLLVRLDGKTRPSLKSDWPNSKLVEEVSKVLERIKKTDSKSLDLVSELISALEQAKEDPSKIERHKKGSIAQQMLDAWEQEKASHKPVELSKTEWKRWLDRATAIVDGELVSCKCEKDEALQQKLVWSDRQWGRYVFADHEGKKSLDVRPEEIAALMAKGRLLILEGWDRPLMDRATYTMLQSIHDRLIEQTNHDALTGLLNRRGFESALDALLARAKNQDSKNILVYLDLDRFNVVNATCGHEAGDELLGNLSGILRRSVGDEVVIARLGGDEFGVLLENHDRVKGMKKAETIHEAIGKFRFKCENKEFTVDASFGVAEIDAQCDSVRTLLAAVDSACFAAKEAGRGRIQFYDAGSEVIRKRQGIMDWVGRINKLFEAGLIQLKCQKMVSLKYAHERPRYEVLLNVFNEEGDLVSLDQFVMSAEIYNRILDIDKFVVDKVFEWIHNHRPIMNKLGSLSINLSGHSLDNEEFMESLVQRMEHVEVPSHQICFEITETAAIGNLERATYYMRRLRQAGCALALDDFGSGHASYSYLKSMPIDFLKIDGQFIRNIGTNVFDFSVVKSIHEMGRALGKRTVAEYVESEVALDKLRKIGVDYGQGYVIEKPIPIDQLVVEYQ